MTFATVILEGTSTASPHNEMDRHNNALGIQIGLSKSKLYNETFIAVRAATLTKDADQTVAIILEKEKWGPGF